MSKYQCSDNSNAPTCFRHEPNQHPSTHNHKDTLNYIREHQATLRAEEDSLDVTSEGDASSFIDGWLDKRHVEAAEQRVGVLSQVLLDIGT